MKEDDKKVFYSSINRVVTLVCKEIKREYHFDQFKLSTLTEEVN